MRRPSGYQIVETLHEDERVVLCRAWSLRDAQAVVLKFAKGEHPSPRELAKLRHEHAISRELLSVPGVMHVAALEKDGAELLLVMEDFDGRTLPEIVRTKRLALRAILEITASIADTLASIHRRGVICKDVQPNNLIVHAETLETRLTNFGIATQCSLEFQKAVRLESLDGSLPYMSPEQTGRMNRTLDRRTDLYSLGVTVYELLTGVLPFSAHDPMRILHGHIAKRPSPPHEISTAVPRVVSDIVMKLLSKPAENRYQHAGGLAADLRECIAQLDSTGQLAAFPLARRDRGDELRLPQRLYGREAEVERLRAAWNRVDEGAVEVVLVSGYAGVGKSALVNEIHQGLAGRGGHFIAGKFDQFNRNVPYAPIAEALRDLVRSVVSQREDVLAAWRSQLVQALGPNGQLLVDLIPDLSLLIGPQPRVPDLGPTETQNRFNLAFQGFFRVAGAAGHPLAIFLDDLQWADPASLKLLQHLLLEPGGSHLLLISAYRDNEVDAGHPLSLALNEIRKQCPAVTEIALGPLAPAHVGQFVAEALGCDTPTASPLSEVVLEKTQGNPFFMSQFLLSLHNESLLTFDPTRGAFSWDLGLIKGRMFTDNVVVFMAGKIEKLAPVTQHILLLAACMGHRFDLETLSLVYGKSPAETAAALWESLREGFILPLDSNHRSNPLGGRGPVLTEDEQGLNASYKFLHDRIQQAAYSLLAEDRKQAVHLRIGRLLLQKSGQPPRDEDLFEIVRHLNSGSAQMRCPEERAQLARLNCAAGKRAKHATAYEAAAGHFKAGMDLLGDGGFDRDWELVFTLAMGRAECEYLSGRFDQAESLFNVLLARAQSPEDRARVQNLRMVLYITQGRVAEAVNAGRSALALFGIELPEVNDALKAALRADLAEVESNLGGRRIEELYDAPEMADPVKRLMLELLTNLDAPAYQTDPALHALVVVKKVNLSLRYGHSELSAFAYMAHGWNLASHMGRYQEANAFGELALKLNEKFKNADLMCKLNGMFGAFSHFVMPLRSRIDFLRKSYRAGLVTGDFPYLSYNCFHTILVRLGLGDELGEVRKEIDTFLSLMRRTRDAPSTAVLTLAKQLIANLMGQTRSRRSLTDAAFDEEDFLAEIEGTGFIVCAYYTMKTLLLFVHGEHEHALAAASLAEPWVASSGGYYFTTELSFYICLTILSLPPARDDIERTKRASRLAEHQNKLARWAAHCPANYLHARQLVLAEVARTSSEYLRAIDLYDEAIRLAEASEFPHHKAMACELAARFYLGRGQPKIAGLYLTDALAGYRGWGATAKVADLEARYAAVLASQGPVEAPRATGADTIDLLAVIRASQALSSEIDRARLLKRLMTISLEVAGAERGCLLRGGETLVVEAEAFARFDEIEVSVYDGAPLSLVPPESIMNYAQQTGKSLILDDASADPRFTWDEQVARAGLKSVLCLPLIRQAVRVGVLYLENNLTAGAFVQSRVAVLELLGSQAAISLENASLLSQEQAARAAAEESAAKEQAARRTAEEAERRSSFLANAAAILSESLEYDETLARVSQLCAGSLADFCVIDVLVDAPTTGGAPSERKIRRLSGAHSDPTKEPVLAELERRYPPTWDSLQPPSEVLRTGLPLLIPDVPSDVLQRFPTDIEHIRLILELGLQSWLSVPLMARGQLLGVLSCASTAPERRYGPADLTLAEEVGRCAALAIDNARLYRMAQDAIGSRDEFLSVASHELRTPVTSLQLVVQRLARGIRAGGPAVSPQMLDVAERQTQRLAALIDQLLDVTRIQSGRLTLTLEEFDLVDDIRHILDRMQLQIERANSPVVLHAREALVGCWDRSRIDQLLTNLLGNALVYGAGQPIDLTVERARADGLARITVLDRGIGIRADRLPHIFERFERATSVRHYGGLGLGLFITREIVQAHHGTVSVESELDRGSRFTVELPLKPPGEWVQ